ncbi:MAG: tetratricopeptide repeat protein [Deltaproteobacteria bacterium]|nr:tetratricopeptide repeat protein [Deltaproteobacteria bacterium]
MKRRFPSRRLLATASALVVAALGAPAAAGEIPKDPKGQKGISPYNEILAQGRRMLQQKDLPGAVTTFQEAARREPQQMLAHVLLAQVLAVKGDLDAALGATEEAQRKVGTEDLQAKLLILRAVLLERKQDWEKAKEAWSAYSVFLTAHPAVAGFRATADERKKRIDEHLKIEKDYEVVKQRIQQEAIERAKQAGGG